MPLYIDCFININFKICKIPRVYNQICFSVLPSHLFSISLYPKGQSVQLKPRPNRTSSSGVRSVQFLSKGHGSFRHASVSSSQFSPKIVFVELICASIKENHNNDSNVEQKELLDYSFLPEQPTLQTQAAKLYRAFSEGIMLLQSQRPWSLQPPHKTIETSRDGDSAPISSITLILKIVFKGIF